MPVVKGDRIGESAKLHDATPEQQDAYARLVATLPDLFGRFRLSWTMIAAAMYPRMEDPRRIGRAAARWQRFVAAFEARGLLRTWEADGLRWAELTGWSAPRNAVYHRTPEPPWGGHEHTIACLPTAIARSRAASDGSTANMLSIRLKELRVAKTERKTAQDTAWRPPRGHHMASTWPSRGHARYTDQRVKCSEGGGSVCSVCSGIVTEATEGRSIEGGQTIGQPARPPAYDLAAERQAALDVAEDLARHVGLSVGAVFLEHSLTSEGKAFDDPSTLPEGAVAWIRVTRERMSQALARAKLSDVRPRVRVVGTDGAPKPAFTPSPEYPTAEARQAADAECCARAGRIEQYVGRSAFAVIAHAADYAGANGQKSRPERMGPARLLNTIVTLDAWERAICALRDAGNLDPEAAWDAMPRPGEAIQRAAKPGLVDAAIAGLKLMGEWDDDAARSGGFALGSGGGRLHLAPGESEGQSHARRRLASRVDE